MTPAREFEKVNSLLRTFGFGSGKRARRGLTVALVAAGLGAAAACGDKEVPAAELGERLFHATSISTGPRNYLACSTCHVVDGAAALVPVGRWDSGYNLHGAAGRPSWWGGAAITLLDAVNVCLVQFMGGRALAPDEPVARQLGAYLAANSPPGPQPAAPLTIVRVVTPLNNLTGDPARGAAIYAAGCQRCHGAIHSGAGALDKSVAVIPESTIHFFPNDARAAFVEKIRHGRFFNIGGLMPLYSLEAMSDADVADLLAYVGL
jgi:thiosulfate dehydrogenase